jgi:putative tricarboxylic transport membrane protein
MPGLSNSPDANPGTGGGAAASRPWWLGGLVVALGALCLYGASGLPQGARYAAIGPGLFVTLAGAGLVILGLMLLVQIARGERFEPQDAEDAAANVPADHKALAIAFAAAVVPIITMQPLGLPITAMISFVLVARALHSKRLVMDIVAGLALGIASWFLFTELGLQLGGFLPIAGL